MMSWQMMVLTMHSKHGTLISLNPPIIDIRDCSSLACKWVDEGKMGFVKRVTGKDSFLQMVGNRIAIGWPKPGRI